MKVISQSNEVIFTTEVELCGATITCVPDYDISKRKHLGTYNDRKRAVEVYSELSAMGWNDGSEYTMPKE